MKKDTIQLDSILQRYLSDIEFDYDSQKGTHAINGVPIKSIIRRFTADELEHKLTHQTEERFGKFIEFFRENGSLSFHSYEEHLQKYGDGTMTWADNMETAYLKDPYFDFSYEKLFLVEVKNIDFIRKFRKEHTAIFDSETRLKFADDNHRFIYMDESGRFFFGEDRQEVFGMNNATKYYKVLAALYLVTNGSGVTTIHKINEKIKSTFGGETYLLKDMRNAFQDVEKYVPTTLPSGAKIFEFTKESINFKNPKINLSGD